MELTRLITSPSLMTERLMGNHSTTLRMVSSLWFGCNNAACGVDTYKLLLPVI